MKKPGKKFKVVLIFGAIILIVGYLGLNSMKPKPTSVTSAAVTKGNLTQIISVSGKLEPNDSQTEALAPTQKVSKIRFKEGDLVKSGDIILEYDKADIVNQLEKARINLKLQKLQLKNLQESSSTTDKEAAANAVNQAKIALSSVQTTFDQVTRNHEYNKELYDQGFLAKEEFLASEKNLSDITNQLESAKITLSNAEGNYTNFEKSTTLQITNQKEQMAMTQLDIDRLTKTIGDTTMKAAIGGTLVTMDAKEQQFTADQGFVKIYDLSNLKISINVSQYDAANVKMDQKATVKVKGVQGEFEGTVSKIGYIAEGVQGQEAKVNVEITVKNPSEQIKVGFEADVDLITSEKQNVIYVNYDSVKKDSDGSSYVFVIVNEATASTIEKRVVETGLETDFDIEITGGLNEGDLYVSNPTDTLKAGDLIKVVGGK